MTHFFKNKKQRQIFMKYQIFKHDITIENKIVETYGINIYENEVLVDKLYDISTDYHALSQLVYSLNIEKIDLVHFDSIIEDFYLDNV